MKSVLQVLACALVSLGSVFAQQPSSSAPAPPPTVPAQAAPAAPLTNPVKPTAESQAHARKVWGYDCAMCHGDNGNGKGDVAISDKLTIPDYTNADTLKNYSDGELFVIIRDGKDKMPEEGSRAKPDDIWNLVIYMRSMAKKPAA